MKYKERKKWDTRAIAVGLLRGADPKEIEAAEIEKGIKPKVEESTNNTVASVDQEEDTKKIFNLSETPLIGTTNNTATNKKVERNPVKAWGQK